MANTLGNFIVPLFANEGLRRLKMSLGMGSRVYGVYEDERRSFGRGDVVNLRRPSDFTVQDAPGTAEDLDTDSVQISLSHWRTVKFKLNDKEASYVGMTNSLDHPIITQHMERAAYRLAADVDTKLGNLFLDVPWHYDITGSLASTAQTDIPGVAGVLFDNEVPLAEASRMHLMLNGTLYTEALGNAAFSQDQGAGAEGVETQRMGEIGMKYGLQCFRTQNVQSYTPGSLADAAGTADGAHVAGATTLNVAAISASSSIKQGDTLVIAGNTQRYAVTADATSDGSGDVALSITPPLAAALSGGEVVTIDQSTDSGGSVLTLTGAYHEEAFARVIAPLPDVANQLGAQVFTAVDPDTGISLRARIYYVGGSSEIECALDILYGVKTLNENLACRFRNAN